MPLVFVHGVSNRDSDEYRENELSRDEFLRALVAPKLGLKPEGLQILNPYWGDDGVKFRWGNASLPQSVSSMEHFGTVLTPADLRVGAAVLARSSPDAADIIAVANRSLAEAIDIIWSAAFPFAKTRDEARALAESYERALNYASIHPKPSWLAGARNSNFVDLLLYEVKRENVTTAAASEAAKKQLERFGNAGGLLDRLKEAVSRVTSVGSSTLSSAVLTLWRKKAHLGASLFLGDIFQYLNTRGDVHNPGPIVRKVLSALREARAGVNTTDAKLIVMGHSLGGVISYDILTYFDPTVEVDVFVTVGSQVALFEEMTLYKNENAATAMPAAAQLSRPANIKRWLNVLDANDMFSFRVGGVFEGASDFMYETGFGLANAHSGYFERPSFYDRLGERLAQS